jgi:hypothetical protein
MSINVGLGSGTARQTTENIERLMAVQEKMVAGGGLGTLVLPQNLYAAAVRHAETIGFKDASAFFNDPSTVFGRRRPLLGALFRYAQRHEWLDSNPRRQKAPSSAPAGDAMSSRPRDLGASGA